MPLIIDIDVGNILSKYFNDALIILQNLLNVSNPACWFCEYFSWEFFSFVEMKIFLGKFDEKCF